MTLTPAGAFLRFLFALLLVMLTYNPSGTSYVHWVYQNLDMTSPYQVISGVALLIGWGIYLKATMNSLGFIGIVAAGALLGCLLWLLIYWGLLSIGNATAMTWVIELLLAVMLTIGMCWSHITRRLSGQLDVDEVPED
jgi:hypothetical protein